MQTINFRVYKMKRSVNTKCPDCDKKVSRILVREYCDNGFHNIDDTCKKYVSELDKEEADAKLNGIRCSICEEGRIAEPIFTEALIRAKLAYDACKISMENVGYLSYRIHLYCGHQRKAIMKSLQSLGWPYEEVILWGRTTFAIDLGGSRTNHEYWAFQKSMEESLGYNMCESNTWKQRRVTYLDLDENKFVK
jgi:hypothetical protein